MTIPPLDPDQPDPQTSPEPSPPDPDPTEPDPDIPELPDDSDEPVKATEEMILNIERTTRL